MEKLKSIGSIYSLAINGKRFNSISQELKAEREKLFESTKYAMRKNTPENFGLQLCEIAKKIREKRHKKYIDIYYEIVINKVSKDYNINKEIIMSKSRVKEIIEPRQIVHFLLYLFYPMSYKKISDYFQQDHTTVRNSIEKISNDYKYNSRIKIYIDTLIAQMENGDL
jgi:chromosomal replication initiation ATPase DnaA